MILKPIHKILLVISGILLPLITLIILKLVFNWSWWVIIWYLIIVFVVSLIIGIVILIIKLNKKKDSEFKIDPDEAERIAIEKIKMDEYNPDNFFREDRLILRVGQGTEKTPILWLWGKGTETLNRMDIIVNLIDSSKEICWMVNKPEKFVREQIKLLAQHPESSTVEERTIGRDEMGMPVTRIKTIKSSIEEKKKEEAEKQATETNAY